MSLNDYSRSLGNHGDFLQEGINFLLSQILIQSLNSFSSRSILSKIYRGGASVFVSLTSLCAKFKYEHFVLALQLLDPDLKPAES